MKAGTKPPFASEAELCAAFLSIIPEGWQAYPETAGWDILLVRLTDGYQIGIEAKLKLNGKVLAQALEGLNRRKGPDYRAVLVPDTATGGDLWAIASYVGLTIIRVEAAGPWNKRARFFPLLPRPSDSYAETDWFERVPVERCALPQYVPDVAAGVSSPVQLTDWKIKALRIAVLLETRGAVHKSDFKHIGLDHRRWMTRGLEWLVVTPDGWKVGPHMPDFKAQHPVVFEQIKADLADWAPPAALIPARPKQEALL